MSERNKVPMRNELVVQLTLSKGIRENMVVARSFESPGAGQSGRATYPEPIHLGGR